jgi:hypothetical protein
MDSKEKLYVAMVWLHGSNEPGKRVNVSAESLEAAKAALEAEYGKGAVFNLYNEEEANRVR